MLGLELEDMLFLAMTGAGAMLVGQFFFADRYMFFLPMNWFLLLMVLSLGVPGLMLFKYGKPRRYLVDLGVYYALPRSYCGFAHDQKLKTDFIREISETEAE
jgi:hypothetical protein